MADDTTPDALVTEIKADLAKRTDAIKEIAEKAIAESAKGIGMTENVKAIADEALTGMNEQKARLDELEQKMARKGGDGAERAKSAGYQMIEDEGVKSFMSNPKAGQRVGVEVKAIISSATTLADGSAGDVLVPYRVGMVEPVVRRMTVRDLLTPGRTNQPSIQYAVESGFTNAAATVSETTGPTKPQSDIQFDLVTTSVTTIAHFVLATRQILDDSPMLQSYIDGRLRYGLAYVEEGQLLNGSGTGTNLNGINTQATAFAAGATIIGDPASLLQPRLWGLPVVATQAMASGSFLTGAFKMGAQIFDREDARVEISTEDSDNFRKNLVTILAEERLGLAVYRPAAFIKGTFAAAITDLAS